MMLVYEPDARRPGELHPGLEFHPAVAQGRPSARGQGQLHPVGCRTLTASAAGRDCRGAAAGKGLAPARRHEFWQHLIRHIEFRGVRADSAFRRPELPALWEHLRPPHGVVVHLSQPIPKPPQERFPMDGDGLAVNGGLLKRNFRR